MASAARSFGLFLRWPIHAMLGALFVVPGASAQAKTPDEWWARDKAMHYSVSVMLAADSYNVASAYTEQPAMRALWGAALPLSAGLAKEIYDEAIGRALSWRDLAWDALGTATGTTVAWLFDRYLVKLARRKR